METGCPFTDWVRMATPRHCMGLLQWCPPQAKWLPISGLPWSAHGAAGTCFPGEHFHCGYGVPWWHKKCWRACGFHQHGPRKAVSRVWAPEWKRSSHPSFQVNEDHCLQLLWSYFNLPCVLLAHRPLEKGLRRKKKPYYRPFGPWWRILTATFWQCLLCWFSPSWKDERTVPSVESLGLGKPAQLLPWLLA